MVKHFDHLTIVLRDVERAKMFFAVLGFKEAVSVVIAGEPFASYMGVPGIEADHVTLVLENASPRTEIQLLRYRHPEPLPDAHIRDLYKIGMTTFVLRSKTSRPKSPSSEARDSRPETRSWISTHASWCSSTAPKG